MKPIQRTRKKGGVVGDLVGGTGGLIIMVVISLVIISTLLGANLIVDNGGRMNATENLMRNATYGMAANYSVGINNVSGKIPTILLIAAVVLLFSVLVFLVARYKQMNLTGSGSL